MQIYEDYWRITNAFTDYNGDKFLETLRVCVQFIDENKHIQYSEDKYEKLQLLVQKINPINLISIRKSINQLVKLGFINSYLASYHPDCIEYLKARTNIKRKTLLSKIIYSNSSFNRAVNNDSNLKQINFLIQTLVEVGSLSKEEIIALMLIDIGSLRQPFVTKEELKPYVKEAINSGFLERKYNQIGYLYNLLNKLDDLVFIQETLYFKEDAKQIFGEDLVVLNKKRDAYLHSLYKNQLYDESIELYGKAVCYFEKLDYPVLIASHIKPFILSEKEEEYDPMNGLLLSRTIDSLFDLKYVTFDYNGNIVFNKSISNEIVAFWKDYKLDKNILNEKRLNYLNFHNQLFDAKNIL